MRTPTIDLNEIHPMTDFLRNAKDYARRLKESGQPAVLTVNGQAELVVQDAKSYQDLLLKVREADDVRRLQERVAEMKNGHVRDFDGAFNALEAKHFGKKVRPIKRAKK